MRPLRPLPTILVPKAAKKAETKSNPFKPSKLSTKAAGSSKALNKKSTVPSRARPTVIDPTRYGSRHLSLESSKPSNLAIHRRERAEWIFDEDGQRWVKISDTGEELVVEALKSKDKAAGKIFAPPANNVTITTSAASNRAMSPPHESTAAALSPRSKPIPASSPAIAATAITAVASSSAIPPPTPPAAIDELAIQLADEKAKGLAIMRGLLTKGWAVDLDELDGDADDTEAAARKIVVRRVSVSDESMRSDEEPSAEEEGSVEPSAEVVVEGQRAHANNDEEDVSRIAHAVFDDASSSSDEDIQEDAQERSSQGKSSTIMESSSSPTNPKAALSVDQPPQTRNQTQAASTSAQSRTLKDMFAPREEEGVYLANHLNAMILNATLKVVSHYLGISSPVG